MHSYFQYWASACPEAKQVRAFVIGLEIPDLLKDYRKKYKNGLAEANAVYKTLQEETNGLPDFSKYFSERLMQKERLGSSFGMHFGKKSCPNVKAFWNWVLDSEKANPFWRGYLWHLISDCVINPRLNIDQKIKELSETQDISQNELGNFMKQATRILGEDYYKVNALLSDTYNDVHMTPEVEQLGTNLQAHAPNMELSLIDWNVFIQSVGWLRSYDPLAPNIDDTIEEILSNA